MLRPMLKQVICCMAKSLSLTTLGQQSDRSFFKEVLFQCIVKISVIPVSLPLCVFFLHLTDWSYFHLLQGCSCNDPVVHSELMRQQLQVGGISPCHQKKTPNQSTWLGWTFLKKFEGGQIVCWIFLCLENLRFFSAFFFLGGQ